VTRASETQPLHYPAPAELSVGSAGVKHRTSSPLYSEFRCCWLASLKQYGGLPVLAAARLHSPQSGLSNAGCILLNWQFLPK
jgi:hypothetical protein